MITKREQCAVPLQRRATKYSEQQVDADDIVEFLQLTLDADPHIRKLAVGKLCPCHLKANHARVWDRIIELTGDEDAKVRRHVLHTLCDGSPNDRHEDVVAVIERMHNDPDLKLRRRVRGVLAQYRRSGKINVL
jgi:hypothetical protein